MPTKTEFLRDIVIVGALIVAFLAFIDTSKAESWKHKEDLLPPPPQKQEDYTERFSSEEFLTLERCYFKGEAAATIQIARHNMPELTREQHKSTLLYILVAEQYPPEMVDIYKEAFKIVWDRFDERMQAGHVQWIVHNECVEKDRELGLLPPLTPPQAKEYEEIKKRMYGEGYWPVASGGDGIIEVNTDWQMSRPDQLQPGGSVAEQYCAIFSTHVETVVPFKRLNYSRDYLAEYIVEYYGELTEDYINHWMKVIDFVYTNDYEYVWEYGNYAYLDCMAFFDERGAI